MKINLLSKNNCKHFIFNLFYLLLFVGILQLPFGCKKEEVKTIEIPQYDSIVDVENNHYKVVKIGNQWWMTENLKVKSFNDGTPMRNAESDIMWKAAESAFCIYRNDLNAPGLLYNWFAVNDTRQIAPKGWHVATESDWQILETYLGMPSTAISKIGWRGANEGSKLKAEGKKGWLTETDFWPTNESRFSALAGSCRKQDAVWGDPGLFQTGFWWTATDHKEGKAYYRYLDCKSNQIFRHYDYKNCGYSVRCVKNE